MSVKPTKRPRWATAPVPDGVIEPPEIKKDVGWVPGERPPAEYMNWLLQNLYSWVEWLDEGDCAFDALSAVTLAVSGTSTLQTLSVPGVATIGTLNATTATAGTLSVTGASTLTGLLSANGGVTVPSGRAVNITGTSTLDVVGTTTLGTTNVTGLLSGNGGITAQAITTTGTDTIKHPPRERYVHAAAFQPRFSSSIFESFTTTSPVANYSHTWRFGTLGLLVAPLSFLRTGDRITGIMCHVGWAKATTSPAVTFAVESDSLSVTGSTFTQYTHALAPGGAPNTGIIPFGFLTGLNVPIVANVGYMLTVSCNGTANDPQDMHFMGFRIFYDRP